MRKLRGKLHRLLTPRRSEDKVVGTGWVEEEGRNEGAYETLPSLRGLLGKGVIPFPCAFEHGGSTEILQDLYSMAVLGLCTFINTVTATA